MTKGAISKASGLQWLAREALESTGRLSRNALVTACRFMCLSAARIGDAVTLDFGIKQLVSASGDGWAKSNVAFLRGFNERMKGHLPAAETYFREAYDLSAGSYSIARELAAIYLSGDYLDLAGQFAREAYGISSGNPYVFDILIGSSHS